VELGYTPSGVERNFSFGLPCHLRPAGHPLVRVEVEPAAGAGDAHGAGTIARFWEVLTE